MPHRTFLCRLILCAVFSVSIVNVFKGASSPSFFLHYARPVAFAHNRLVCPQSELADDVLVVLRTGATESLQKVPVHFKTTLRCVPNFLILSDMDEEIEGHPVHDVLKDVSEQTKKNHQDFQLYRRLQENGRQGLGSQKVITSQSGSFKGDYLNTDNDGWQLDKWKFLPSIDEAYKRMPDAKWFVFIEADTYLSWHNLLEYLSAFDETKPYYIGKHLFIKGIEFGYGGAGFVLSNPAMQKVSEQRSLHVDDYESFTATHWVGDCALGKAVGDAKIPLHRAYPHFQGDSPSTMDPTVTKIDRPAWCSPIITYHHMSPVEIEQLWMHEQNWHKKHTHLVRHRDIFHTYIHPQLSPSKAHWDNLSLDQEFNAHDHHRLSDPLEANAWKSFSHCQAVCESKRDCLQFSYEPGSCSTSMTFRLGYAKPSERVQSGWIMDRVDQTFLEMDGKCSMSGWFGPEQEPASSFVERRRRRR